MIKGEPPTHSFLTARTIIASRGRREFALLGELIFAGGLWIASRDWSAGMAFIADVILGILGAAMLATLYLMLRRLPQLMFDEHGIAWRTLFRTRRWTWDDVGPFTYSEAHGRDVPGGYICANSDARHDLLLTLGEPTTAKVAEAAIAIPVRHFDFGGQPGAIWALVAEINAFRHAYGTPQVEIGRGDPALQLDAHDRRQHYRRYWPAYVVGAAILAFVAYLELWP